MKKYYIFKLNLSLMNIFLFILIFGLILFTSLFVNYDSFLFFFETTNYLLFYFIYMILHEIIHGVSYYLNGAKFKNITFGMMLEKGILYCLCKQNISKKNIMISSLAPFVVIGLFTYIVGLLLNNYLLITLSILNIAGCTGDFFTFNFLLKLKDIEFSEMDDPTGFAIYSSEDLSKIKSIGIKYVGVKDNIKRNDLKRITISKFSIILTIGIIILSVLTFIY